MSATDIEKGWQMLTMLLGLPIFVFGIWFTAHGYRLIDYKRDSLSNTLTCLSAIIGGAAIAVCGLFFVIFSLLSPSSFHAP